MNKIFLASALAAVVLAATSAALLHHAAVPAPRAKAHAPGPGLATLVDKGPTYARQIVAGLTLPKRIDAAVSIDSAEAVGPTVVVTATVETASDALDRTETAAIAASACADKKLSGMIQKGVMLEYRYVRRSDRHALGRQIVAGLQCLLQAHPEMAPGKPDVTEGWLGNSW